MFLHPHKSQHSSTFHLIKYGKASQSCWLRRRMMPGKISTVGDEMSGKTNRVWQNLRNLTWSLPPGKKKPERKVFSIWFRFCSCQTLNRTLNSSDPLLFIARLSFPNSSMLKKKISLPREFIWLLNSELPAKLIAKCLMTIPGD